MMVKYYRIVDITGMIVCIELLEIVIFIGSITILYWTFSEYFRIFEDSKNVD